MMLAELAFIPPVNICVLEHGADSKFPWGNGLKVSS
jgi:hypothetical protein